MPDTQTMTPTPEASPAPSTTDALFPDFIPAAPQQTAQTPPPEPQVAPPSTTETPEAAAARQRDEKGRFVKAAETTATPAPEPSPVPPTATGSPVMVVMDGKEIPFDTYLQSLEVPLKIGGVEEKKAFADIIRGYQTDQYLTRKGQKLAEQEAKLRQAREATPAQVPATPPASTPTSQPGTEDWLSTLIAPVVAPLHQEIQTLKAQLGEVTASTHDVRKDKYLKAIDAQVREEYGLDNFLGMVTQIESHIVGLDPESAEFAKANTPDGYKSIYRDLMLKDLAAHRTPPKAPATPRTPPTLVSVEGAGGTPTRVEDSAASRQKDLETARKGGSTEHWAAFFRKWP